MKEPIANKILKAALYAVFVGGVACTATLPFMARTWARLFFDVYYEASSYEGYPAFILAFLMAAAVLALWIVLEAILILRTVPKDPFVLRNAASLRRIGALFMALSALFFVKCALYITPLTLVCAFLFVLCGLFAFTLFSLFRRAVAFKEENDLTI